MAALKRMWRALDGPREMGLTIHFALRELRGGILGLRLMLLALALGVAMMAAIGVLADALYAGIGSKARILNGGDVSFSRPYMPATEEEQRYLSDQGTLSLAIEMRSMAAAEQADGSMRRRLIELKAVDGLYPLVGTLLTEPPLSVETLFGERDGMHGAAVDRAVLQGLNVSVGERVRIGDSWLEVRAVIAEEPDRVVNNFQLGPRVLVHADSLAESGLLTPGSLMTYRYRLLLEDPGRAEDVAQAIEQQFPDSGARVRTVRNAAPRLEENINRLEQFLSLVALAVMVTGGIGMANGVAAWLARRQQTMAVLKCVGATSRQISQIYMLQLAILAIASVLAGLIVGALLPPVLAPWLATVLPVTPEFTLHPTTLAASAAFGLLMTLLFALQPIYQACAVRPARIFRAALDAAPLPRLPLKMWLLQAICVASILWLAWVYTNNLRLTVSFAAGIVLAMVVLLVVAGLMRRLSMVLSLRGGLVRRYAARNLHRPGAPTRPVMLSLGIGLALLVALALVERNFSARIGEGLPDNAPALYLLDIQPSQLVPLRETVMDVAGQEAFNSFPMLRGRVTHINGVPGSELTPPSQVAWVLRGDRGFTFARQAPDYNAMVEGEWWSEDYTGEPLVSLERKIAEGFGLAIGDSISVNILGKPVTARIANIRELDWTTYQLNFAFIFSPGVFDGLPYTVLASVDVAADQEYALADRLHGEFSNISVIHLREVLKQAGTVMSDIAMAVRVVSSMAIFMGVMVMAVALGANLSRRTLELTVLKVLGATRRMQFAVLGMEFALLGVVTALAAAGAGALAAWAVMVFIIRSPYEFYGGVLGITVVMGMAVAVLLGLIATWRALGVRPLSMLRNE